MRGSLDEYISFYNCGGKRAITLLARVPNQMESGPEVRMNAIGVGGCTYTGEKGPLGTRQGGSLAILAQQCLVEHLHQFGTAGIIHLPERGQQRSGTGIEEAAPKPDDFIHAAD